MMAMGQYRPSGTGLLFYKFGVRAHFLEMASRLEDTAPGWSGQGDAEVDTKGARITRSQEIDQKSALTPNFWKKVL
jgi:hypothetical protein